MLYQAQISIRENTNLTQLVEESVSRHIADNESAVIFDYDPSVRSACPIFSRLANSANSKICVVNPQ